MSLENDGAAQLEIVVPRLGQLVGQVQPADMARSTPCDDWTVRDLLNHLVGGATMFAGAMLGEPLRDISGRMPDVVGQDPPGAFAEAVERFGANAASPGAMEREYSLPFGVMDGPTVLCFIAFDLTVHTWDLATSLATAPGLPEDLVEEASRFARQGLDGWRDHVNFRDAADPPDGGDALEQLVAFTGRRVPAQRV